MRYYKHPKKILYSSLMAALLATGMLAPAHADGLKEKVEENSESVNILQEELDSVIERLGKTITVGGYGTTALEVRPNGDSKFNSLRLNVLTSGSIHDNIRFYNEIEFKTLGVLSNNPAVRRSTCTGPDGTTVRCVTGIDTNSGSSILSVAQSFLDFLIVDWINFKVGAMLVPFGEFNLRHFDPNLDFYTAPLVTTRIVPSVWTDVGAQAFGKFLSNDVLTWDYQVGLFNGLDDNIDSTNLGLRGARPNFGKDNNGNKAVVGRTQIKLFEQYSVGFSGYYGAYDKDDQKFLTGFNGDLFFRPAGVPILEDFEFKGEFSFFNVGLTDAPSNLMGYYGQLNYHFWPFPKPFWGFSEPTLTALVRYGSQTINTSALKNNFNQNRLMFGLNFRPQESIVIKTEYQLPFGDQGVDTNNAFVAAVSWFF